jgi:hypothetical protein
MSASRTRLLRQDETSATQPRAGPANGLPPWWRTGEKWVLAAATVAVAGGWSLVVLTDVLGLGEPVGVTREAMTWVMLFGPAGPIEWIQWIYMIFFIAVGAYLVGRWSVSDDQTPRPVRRFCLLMTVGMGFMLLEDAGDIRHMLNYYVERFRGTEEALFGLPQGFVIDAQYFALVAAIPLFALIRYGRSIWAVRSARPYLTTGFGIYGVLALGHVLGRLGESGSEWGGVYGFVGQVLNRRVFAGALEPGHMSEAMLDWHLTDLIVEESLELLAMAAMVGLLIVLGRETATRVTADHRARVSAE